jgi:hypothetical protein
MTTIKLNPNGTVTGEFQDAIIIVSSFEPGRVLTPVDIGALNIVLHAAEAIIEGQRDKINELEVILAKRGAN